jgi:hypothetical protein
MKIEFSVVQHALMKILAHVQTRELSDAAQIEIAQDYYWFIQTKELYDVDTLPVGMTIGSLSFDMERIERIAKVKHYEAPFDLILIACVLRAIRLQKISLSTLPETDKPWVLKIDLSDVQKVAIKALAIAQVWTPSNGTQIEITEDLYWFIHDDELYDVENAPTRMTRGSLTSDLEVIQKIASGETQPTRDHLTVIACVLRAMVV